MKIYYLLQPEEQSNENEMVKKQLDDEKHKTRLLGKANRMLQEKCMALQEKLNSTTNTSKTTKIFKNIHLYAKRNIEFQMVKITIFFVIGTEPQQAVVKSYPEPINTRSGIQARCDGLHEAYSKDEPSTFYINMCYSIWGYEELAEVLKNKKKDTCRI